MQSLEVVHRNASEVRWTEQPASAVEIARITAIAAAARVTGTLR